METYEYINPEEAGDTQCLKILQYDYMPCRILNSALFEEPVYAAGIFPIDEDGVLQYVSAMTGDSNTEVTVSVYRLKSPFMKYSPVSAEEAAVYLKSAPFRNFVFDVDDTLYLRSDPYIRAYQKCFHSRIENEGCWPEGAELFRISRPFVEEEYLRRVKGEIDMNEMLVRRTLRSFSKCGIQLTAEEALLFEETYEKEQAHIRLIPQFGELLAELCGSGREAFLGILTNGPSTHQRNKIHALGLTRWIPEEHIVVSGDIGV